MTDKEICTECSEPDPCGCPEGERILLVKKGYTDETCPGRGRYHTPVPEGYVERGEDAEARLAKGQFQKSCPVCGLWAMWYTQGGGRAQGSS